MKTTLIKVLGSSATCFALVWFGNGRLLGGGGGGGYRFEFPYNSYPSQYSKLVESHFHQPDRFDQCEAAAGGHGGCHNASRTDRSDHDRYRQRTNWPVADRIARRRRDGRENGAC